MWIAVNDWECKLLQVIANEQKWPQMIKQWMQVNASECKWLHVNDIEQGLVACVDKWTGSDCKWMQGNKAITESDKDILALDCHK